MEEFIMAKIGSKYKLQDIIPLQTIINTVNSSTNNILLEIGRAVAPREYAVRFYSDREQPQFYMNEERLLYTVHKAICISSCSESGGNTTIRLLLLLLEIR